MAADLKNLPPPNDSRQFLASLKKVLENVKLCGVSNNYDEVLSSLVFIYLNCPARIPAKRVIASFFQNLQVEQQSLVERNICEQLSQRMCIDFAEDNSVTSTSHCVDIITGLMENFQMGERCLSSFALKVIKFLATAEEHFLSQVHDDVPPVFLNEVMQRCHVTVQTLNLVLQKTVVGCAELTNQILADSKMLTFIMTLNLKILKNELFLLDCRCCCAMNAVVLLQLSLDNQEAAQQIPSIISPMARENSNNAGISWLTLTQAESLNMATMSTLSYLAVAFGYITAVNPQSIVLEVQTGWFFYLDSLLPDLLSHGIKSTIQNTHLSENFSAKFVGQSSVLCNLLEYVWTHWDDQLDAVRQSSKSVFENVLNIHSLINSGNNNRGKLDSFMESILTHLFAVSWTSRGKFSALTSSVHLVGTQIMIDRRPELPGEILMQLQEQALSCYASELYTALFASHRELLSLTSEHHTDWSRLLLNTWLEPVIAALCSSNRKLKQNIIEYLLSKLMKCDDQLLGYMIQRLSATGSDQVEPFHGVVIMCLRRAQVLGLLRLTPAASCSDNLWYGHLHSDVLKTVLCNSDEQIRLDAFALLCDNYKTTETVTALEFSMLKFFIPYNLNNQSPSFRQSFLSLLNKLFYRLKESLGALRRQIRKDKESNSLKSSLLHYKNFLMWMVNHLLHCLYPGSAFARRTSSLAIISLMSSYFVTEQDGFALPEKLTKYQRQALLECLTDTFEENKREALKICISYLAHQGIILDKQELQDLMKVSMSLACSTRPQDGSTAAYNFLLILKQLEYHPSQFDVLTDILPLQVLPSSQVPIEKEKNNAPLFLLNMLLSLLDDQINVASQFLITAAANRPMYPTLLCIRYLMQELDFKCLPPDVIPAARVFIQRLVISCLNLARVVSPVVQNSSPEGNIPEALLDPGLNINSVLDSDQPLSDKDQDCHPLEQDSQPTANQSDTVALSRALVESMPEYLIVCCWRSIKEVSLTLGNMCLQIPVSLIAEDGTNDALLFSLDQVKIVGEYFTTQLLESIHRGAFELAYAGFQLMCQMLWNHPVACFHHLPSQWLSDVITNMKSGHLGSKLCSTRRSAGVPFFVQAVTSTEPAATGRKCFHSIMKELLVLAISRPDADDREEAQISSHAQVHALNILRALFRDARLGEDVVQYVADGLQASILGFKSEQWAVQNSATLLLSALMTRMFGVKRSKDETMSKKIGSQTGRAFFHRYPSLYPFLLSELEEATTDVGSKCRSHLGPSLYPVLLVLGRLFPSTHEGSDSNLNLSAFIPHVIRCAASPVYKTRVIASRALQPLARSNHVICISRQLFNNLPETGASVAVSSNHIHGSLLQLYQLANLMTRLATSISGNILDAFLTNLNKRTWLISSSNTCFATRQASLELINIVLDTSDAVTQKSPEHIKVLDELRETFLAALVENVVSSRHLWQPLYFDFEKTRARLCLKHLASLEKVASRFVESQEVNGLIGQCGIDHGHKRDKPLDHFTYVKETQHLTANSFACDLLLKLLGSPLYEVRLEVLDSLLTVWRTDGVNNTSECYPSSLDSGDLDIDGSGVHMNNSGLSVGQSKSVIKELAPALFDHILHMAVETEAHHECLQKIFYVLDIVPDCRRLLSEKGNTQIIQIFTSLLTKIQTERRNEVKAAMLRFSGHLVGLMYSNLSSAVDELDQGLQALKQWVDLVKANSAIDVDPEVQISCCHILQENARVLLYDPDNKLGNSTFVMWDCLAILLQEDDLEVKDIASSVLCLVHGVRPGSYHSSYALHCLPGVLASIHSRRNLPGVVSCLLRWILYDDSYDITDTSERLFDKGEMNVYRDQVAFTRSIAATLASLFHLDLDEHFSNFVTKPELSADIVTAVTQTESEMNMVKCGTDITFSLLLLQVVSSLTSDLELLCSTCNLTDVYMNSARYTCLCQIVYTAKMLLILFDREEIWQCRNTFRENFSQLGSVVLRVCTELQLGNSLTC